MAVNRRAFVRALALGAMTTACSPGKSVPPPALDCWWQAYRDRFLDPSGRIVDTGNGGISHSEGQGYGMVFAVLAGDLDAFARMARWTEATLRRRSDALHSWRYDPRSPVPVGDPNNAADGDLLIAWALALAGTKSGNGAYAAQSREIRAAIDRLCVTERFGRRVLLPGVQGFASGSELVLNPSYYVWPALDTFARLDGAARWGRLIADGEALIAMARFGPNHLPSDWVALSGHDELAPARDRPPRFGYDAIRVPLYAAAGRRARLVEPVAAFWSQRLAQMHALPAWIDVVTGEEAAYPLSEGGLAVAANLLHRPQPASLARDYYAASLQMLARSRLGQG
jgi:endoglucanase